MTSFVQRVAYLGWAGISLALERNPSCPDCGGKDSSLVDAKFFVTQLRRCGSCSLMFRRPVETHLSNKLFYNILYKQGFTTDLPTEAELVRLLAAEFRGSPKDFSRYIELLGYLGVPRGAKLFDFGASWGYGSWQLRRAGFHVQASEISRSRREFAAERLGIDMVADPFDSEFRRRAKGQFDVFFSSHVLEHVPAPSRVWELARDLVKPGGLFVAITPNGASEARAANPNWRKLWGLVHPNLIDDEYYLRRFPAGARLVASLPVEPSTLADWRQGDLRLQLSGPELVFAARL